MATVWKRALGTRNLKLLVPKYVSGRSTIRFIRSNKSETKLQETEDDFCEHGIGKYRIKSPVPQRLNSDEAFQEDFFGIESDINVKYVPEIDDRKTKNEAFHQFLKKRDNRKARERFVNVSFGEARFDSDNVVKYHGQYEREEEILPILEGNSNLNNRATLSEGTGDKTRSKYEMESSNQINDPDLFDQRSMNFTEESQKYEHFTPDQNISTDARKSMRKNYFDEQYFPNVKNRENVLKSKENSEILNLHIDNHTPHHSKRSEPETQQGASSTNLNYVDDQYFSQITTNDSTTNPPVEFENDESENKLNVFERSSTEKHLNTNVVQKDIQTESENYFEEHYFPQYALTDQASEHENIEMLSKESVADKIEFENKIDENSNSFVNQTDEELNTKCRMEIPLQNESQDSFSTVKRNKKHLELISQQNNLQTASLNLGEKPESKWSLPKKAFRNENKTNRHNESVSKFTTKLQEDESNSYDVRNKHLNVKRMESHKHGDPEVTNIGSKYLGDEKYENNHKPFSANMKTKYKGFEKSETTDTPETAFDYVLKRRREAKTKEYTENLEGSGAASDIKPKLKIKDERLDSKGFRVLRDQVQDLRQIPEPDVLTILKHNVLYNENEIFAINKPYGISCQGGENAKYTRCLTDFLPKLAQFAHNNVENSRLHYVHRLDRDSTGVLLFAKNEKMARKLSDLFAEGRMVKKYWALTKAIPEISDGTIDIPICEAEVEGKKRMVLHPNVEKEYRNLFPKSKDAKRAITHYSIIQQQGDTALLEIQTETGLKHQIRVHLGLGLRCPIIGDHKYSCLDKIVPQKLPDSVLAALNIRQSKVRYVPMHLHAKTVVIPEIVDGKNIFISAPLPKFFTQNLQKLHYRKK